MAEEYAFAPESFTFTNHLGVKFRADVDPSVDKPIVSFWDITSPERFGERGQKVSEYYVDDALEGEHGLDLYGGVPQWVVDTASMLYVRQWLRDVLELSAPLEPARVPLYKVIATVRSGDGPTADVRHYTGNDKARALAALTNAALFDDDEESDLPAPLRHHILSVRIDREFP